MLTLDPNQPWLKAPEESPKGYAAFEKYMELPADKRSVFAAWESATKGSREGHEFPGTQTVARLAKRRASEHWYRWCGKFEWVDRAASWDAHQSALLRRKFAEEAAKDKIERIKMMKAGRGMVLKAMAKLDAYLKDEDSTVKFLEVFTAMRLVNDELRNEYDDQPAQRHQFTEAELDAEINRKVALLAQRQQAFGGWRWEEEIDDPRPGKFDEDLWSLEEP